MTDLYRMQASVEPCEPEEPAKQKFAPGPLFLRFDEEGDLEELHLEYLKRAIADAKGLSQKIRFDVLGTSHWDGMEIILEFGFAGCTVSRASAGGMVGKQDSEVYSVYSPSAAPAAILAAIYELEVEKVMKR